MTTVFGARESSTGSRCSLRDLSATPKAASKPAKSEPVARKRSAKGSSSPGAARTAKPGLREGPSTLREVLTGIFKNSHKPLSARELAAQILASGYRSNSKEFVKVVSIMLTKMANVEHVPEKGYRLTKT
jgi:hypothetical protein